MAVEAELCAPVQAGAARAGTSRTTLAMREQLVQQGWKQARRGLTGLRGLVAVTALAVGVSIVPGAAFAATAPAPPPAPVSPEPAPGQSEGFAPYLPQVSCDPTIKPGTASFRSTMLAAYGGRDLGVARSCEIGARSEHKEGRAWDWGLDSSKPAEKALATAFLDWLLAPGENGMSALNARRLGVMYVIYDGRIWSSYRAGEGWRPYSGGESHGDHLHISLAWTGAMARASWWTGKAAATDYGPCVEYTGVAASPWSAPRATPCPTPINVMTLTGTPLLKQGSTGPYVTQLQRLLGVSPVSGFFGPITEAAVRALQQSGGLSVTGTTTPPTWAAARGGTSPAPVVSPPPATPSTQTVTAGRSLPARMTVKVRPGDTLGTIAKRWRSTVAAIRSASGLRSDVIQVGQRLSVPVRSGLTRYTWKKRSVGDRNRAVKVLQSSMGMRKKYRTGFFGPKTERKVDKLKARRGWSADGVAGPGVWRALGA